ncbi:hypothetical protein [Proteus phage PM2]|uniref:Long tail fiber protein Gp37 n=1 Tax=Proteus phage PM2 TaxID=2025809 RepID=A0A249XWZ7_9CAUD|nr:long tail fiber protein distal subunit [Proteus phage PM2]ASZ76505.1 hypothetical protein [Proteus phage PM2]
MAKIPRIQFKRTKNPGVKPSKDILAEGELAINLADRMLFTKSGEEIIDLGFAKGGTVNGDIIQETGNFTTNGNIRLKEYLNINGPDNKALNIAYDSRGPLIGVNEGDNKWKVLQIPAETGTFASREWVNTFVKSGSIQTDLKAPDNTTVLTINNSKLLSFKDGTTDIFAVDIKGGYMRNSLILSGQNDYPGITLQKNDTFKVRIETDTDSSNTLLAFAYRDSGNSNKFVIKMPKENGVLASQQWVDGKYYKRDDSPTFKGQVNIGDKGGNSNYAQLSYESGEARWSVNTGSWKILKHPNENGTVATQERINKIVNHNGQQVELISPNGTMKATLQNNGTFSTWNGNGNPISVDASGNTSVAGTIQAVSTVTARTANSNTIFGLFVRDKEAFLSLNIDNKWVGELHHPKTHGTIATQQWSNGQHYTKSETYNKSEIDGKVNGRLTQSQADGRYVRMDLTNLGKQYTPLTGIASGQWGKPIGYSVMVNSASSPQRPPNTGYGYWHVIGARDQSNGYAGIWGGYSDGQMYYGNGNTAATNPTWYKIYTSGNKPSPSELGVYAKGEVYSKAESDARYPLKNDVYAKSSTYSRAEVDSRVNGRLTQSQADGRYAYKGGATGQNFGANIVDAADVNIRSDISVKSNLVYIKNALDLLKPLTGYKYDLRLNDNTHKQSVGIIAQDVQKVLPELVQKDSTDLLSVNYNGLTAVLINAVNELNNRLKELEVKNGSNRT